MYSLEDRIYFDGAAAATLADNNNNTSTSAENTNVSLNTDNSNTNTNSSNNNSTSDTGTAKDTSSAPAKDTSSTTATKDTSSDSSANSGKINIDALIASILNTDTASSDTTHPTLVVSTAVENAGEIAKEAQEHNITVVTYDPAKETLQQLFEDIQTALNGEKASSINFVTTDNSAAGFSLVSASVITGENISINNDISNFAKETASLLLDGGRITVAGDASLTDSSFSALETAFADAAGVKVSFIDGYTGDVTTTAPDAMDYNIVFVDSRAPDSADLLKNLAPNTEVYFLDSSSDGVSQISNYLNGKFNVDSIQIITHGNNGEILLGKTLLSNDNISSYSSEIQNWGKSLTSDGDILIYACNTAETDAGKNFTNEISRLTGADVSVSTDGTGGPSGNWTLEYSTGAIEAARAFDGHDYQYHLATYTVKNSNDSGADSFRLAVANATADGDLVSFLFDGTHTSYAITLSSADINISHGITINGTDASKVSIASSDGYHIVISSSGGGTVTIENVTFSNMNATNGGAIYIDGASTVVNITNTIAHSNNADYGGAIYVNNGTLNLSNSTFYYNSATNNGGAVYIASGTVTLTNVTFGVSGDISYTSANTAVFGGAIFIDSGSLTLSSSNFYYNSTDSGGGAVYINTGATLTFTGSSATVFTGNTTTSDNGGAIYLNNGTISESLFSGSYTFTKNTASSSGGAIHITGSSASVTLTNATFGASGDTLYNSANTATSGGALFIDSGTLTLSDSNFYYNSANSAGGAVYINTAATLIFTGAADIIFTGNKVTSGNSGAIYLNSGTISESSFSGSYTFTGNTASSNGGAIYINGGTAHLTNATFGNLADSSSHNNANNGGAIYLNSGTLTLSDPNFYYNSAKLNGGAVYINTGATLTFTGSSAIAFTDNFVTNGNGGAISVIGGTISESLFSGSYTFTKNTASSNGGTIYITSSSTSLALTNAAFGNLADSSSHNNANNGGAIYLNSGTLTLSDPNFYYNSATLNGGAIFINTGATLTFTGAADIAFIGNKTTTGNGGAIYITGSSTSLTLTNAAFGISGDTSYVSANTAVSGGAIYLNNGHLTLSDSTFYYNSATNNGGAIYINTGATLTFTGSSAIVFTSNRVTTGNAGAIYLTGGTVTCDGSFTGSLAFTKNTAASGSGGAIYIASGSLTLKDAVFGNSSDNTAGNSAANGGAIYIHSSSSSLSLTSSSTTDFYYNSATTNGGSINIYNNNSSLLTLTLSSLKFIGNQSSNSGGAIYISTLNGKEYMNVTLSNCTFGDSSDTSYAKSNTANCGGAVFVESGTTSLNSNNLYYNSATTCGGAIYINANGILNFNSGAITFTGNRTTSTTVGSNYGGGAVYINGGTVTYTAGTSAFTKNIAGTDGGAMYINSGTVSLTSATFGASGDTLYASENKASSGGAIYIYSGTLTLASCNFYYNEATGATENTGGGAIFNYGNNGTYATINAQTCTFTGNKAPGGGAIFNLGILNLGSSSDAGSGCTFTLNVATNGSGGAIFNNHQGSSPAQITAYYSTFGQAAAGNTAKEYGGVLYSYYGVLNFSNCTFSYNTTTNIVTGDGGAFNVYSGTMSLANCTFSNNQSTGTGGAIWTRVTLTLAGTISFDSNTSVSYGNSIYAAGGSAIEITTGATIRETSGTASSVYLASVGTTLSTLTITADTIFSNITITDNGTISIGSGNTMTMNSGAGFANGTGTVSAASGTLLFAANSAASSYVPGGTIYNLTISSAGTKTIAGDLTISHSLEMTDATLNIDHHTLSMSNASWTFTSATLAGTGSSTLSLSGNGTDAKIYILPNSLELATLALAANTTLNLNGKALTIDTSITSVATSAINGNTTTSEIIINSAGTVTLPTISTTSADALYKLTVTKGTVAFAGNSNNYISNIAMNGSSGATATISIGSSSLYLTSSPVVSNYSYSSITGTSSSYLYVIGGTIVTPVSITLPVFSGSLNTLGINAYTSLVLNSTLTIAESGTLTLGTSSNLFLNGYTLTLTGSTVTSTTATGAGAANSKIYGGLNAGPSGEGLILITGGSNAVRTNLSNLTFLNSSNSAVHINAASFANITNCTFSDNHKTKLNSQDGGGLYNQGTVTVTSTQFTNNSVETDTTLTGHGGAIWSGLTGDLTVTNCTFTGNYVEDGSGGAIRSHGNLSITGSTFTSNTASASGGAVEIEEGSSISISGSTFGESGDTDYSSANSAVSGGAIYITSGYSATVDNCNFYYNEATTAGGAIYNAGTLTFTGASASAFTGNNTTAGNGGAIWSSGTIAENSFSGSMTFIKNTATDGGAIYVNGGTSTLSRATFGNTADSSSHNSAVLGGAVYLNIGTLNLNNSNFYYNTATGASGGAIYINGGTLTLSGASDINFKGNASATNGNAVYDAGTLKITSALTVKDTSAALAQIYILNGHTLSLENNVTFNHFAITNDGTFTIGANTLALDSSSVSGILTGGINSSLALTGTGDETLSVLNGLDTLNINRTDNAVTLGADLTVTNSLTLNAGYLYVSNYNLSLGTAATVGGSPSSSAMVLTDGTGSFIKYFNAANPSFLFPVGTLGGSLYEYTPITITFTSAAYGANAFISVYLDNTKETHVTDSSYISRYWTVTSNDISSFSASITAQYLASDVTGTESAIYGELYDPPVWTKLNAVNTSTHSFTGTVSSFCNATAFGNYVTPTATSNNTGNTAEYNYDMQPKTPDPHDNTGKDYISDISLEPPSKLTRAEIAIQTTIWNDLSSRITNHTVPNGEWGVTIFSPFESDDNNPVIIDDSKDFMLSATGTDDIIGLTDNYDYTPMSLWTSKYEKHPLFKSNVDKMLDEMLVN